MKNINLTEEQAKFLVEHLGDLLYHADWESGPLFPKEDKYEHAKSIREKLEKAINAEKW